MKAESGWVWAGDEPHGCVFDEHALHALARDVRQRIVEDHGYLRLVGRCFMGRCAGQRDARQGDGAEDYRRHVRAPDLK